MSWKHLRQVVVACAKPCSSDRDQRRRRHARDETTRGRARGARSVRVMIVHRLTMHVRAFARAQQARHRYPQGVSRHRLHRGRMGSVRTLLICSTLLAFVAFMLRWQLSSLNIRLVSLVREDLNSVRTDMRDLELYSLQSFAPNVPQEVWKNGIDYET